jgi:hypothetical protein
MTRAAEFPDEDPAGSNGPNAFPQILAPAILHSFRAVRIERMSDATDPMTCRDGEGCQSIALLHRIVTEHVGPLFLDPSEMKGHVMCWGADPIAGSKWLKSRPKDEAPVMPSTDLPDPEQIIILKPQLGRLASGNPVQVIGPEPPVLIPRLFETDSVIMNRASRIEDITPRIRQHMDFAVSGCQGPHPGLPLHEFVAEFPDIGACHKHSSGKKP